MWSHLPLRVPPQSSWHRDGLCWPWQLTALRLISDELITVVMVLRLLIAGVIGGRGVFKPHLGAPSRGQAPSLVSYALRAPLSGCFSSHLTKRGRVCWEGAELMALQHGCGSCPSWGLFMVSGKISDARNGQDISKTLLSALPACSDPAWTPWRSGCPVPAPRSAGPLGYILRGATFQAGHCRGGWLGEMLSPDVLLPGES